MIPSKIVLNGQHADKRLGIFTDLWMSRHCMLALEFDAKDHLCGPGFRHSALCDSCAEHGSVSNDECIEIWLAKYASQSGNWWINRISQDINRNLQLTCLLRVQVKHADSPIPLQVVVSAYK